MQLLDFSQVANAAIFVDSSANECCKHPSEQNKKLLKHFILNSVRSNFHFHKKKYGQLVVCCDYQSWRRDYFPNYKYKRRENRKDDASGIKWEFVTEVFDEVISDLKEYFPYPVVKVHKAEGDDVIGVLTKHISTLVTEEDIFGNSDPEDILIISSDKDNFQLHKYKNVKQYSPIQKKLVKPEISWKHSIVEKIVKGETSDGVPNIKSPDDTFVTGTKQKSIMTTYLNEFIASKDPISVCLTEEERVNFIRNETLVSYDKIPQHISEEILLCYNEQITKKHSKMGLMNYLTKNRMSNLLSSIHDFYL